MVKHGKPMTQQREQGTQRLNTLGKHQAQVREPSSGRHRREGRTKTGGPEGFQDKTGNMRDKTQNR